jgi:hypothetical protein
MFVQCSWSTEPVVLIYSFTFFYRLMSYDRRYMAWPADNPLDVVAELRRKGGSHKDGFHTRF